MDVCFFIVLEEFDNYMQQDAHEFLNFLINHINEIILGKYTIIQLFTYISNTNIIIRH